MEGYSKLVLDTSVAIEYVISRSPWQSLLKRLYSSRKVKLFLSSVSLTEIYYVSKRIYSKAGIEELEEACRALLDFLKSSATIVPPSCEIAVEAGRIKDRFGIALGDCFVLATSKKLNAKAVFKEEEEEFKPISKYLREEYGFITLKELSKVIE